MLYLYIILSGIAVLAVAGRLYQNAHEKNEILFEKKYLAENLKRKGSAPQINSKMEEKQLQDKNKVLRFILLIIFFNWSYIAYLIIKKVMVARKKQEQ